MWFIGDGGYDCSFSTPWTGAPMRFTCLRVTLSSFRYPEYLFFCGNSLTESESSASRQAIPSEMLLEPVSQTYALAPST